MTTQSRRRRAAAGRPSEEPIEAFELAIHPDAERLERACRRIDPRVAAARNRAADDRREPPVVAIGVGGCAPRRWHARCAARSAPRRRCRSRRPDRVPTACATRSAAVSTRRVIHPHVERLVALEAEAAARLVELHRRHAEIRQRAVDRSSTPRASSTSSTIAVVRVHELDAIGHTARASSRAMASASRSRSRPMTRVAPASSSARAWPPRPTVQSTKSPPRSGLQIRRASRPSGPGTCGAQIPNSDSARASSSVYGSRCSFGEEAIVVPDFEVIDVAEHVDVAGHRRGLAQADRNEHAALHVEFADLPVVVHAIEEAQPRRMGRWASRSSFCSSSEPHGHRVDADVLARQTRHEQFPAVLAFEQEPEGRRHLEPPLVIDSRRRVAPEHATLLHFCPEISTA